MSELKTELKGGDQVQLADGIINLVDLPHGSFGEVVGFDEGFKKDNIELLDTLENDPLGLIVFRGYINGDVDAAVLPNKGLWFEVSKYDVFIKPM